MKSIEWWLKENPELNFHIEDYISKIHLLEKLLKDIKNTGSHHQINKKIDEYFTELDDAKRSPG